MNFGVSELGIGTWGFDSRSWKDFGWAEAEAAMMLAVERGINLIDTAAAYGEAEHRIGDLLSRGGLSNKVFLATKIAPLVPIDLPSPHIRANEVFTTRHIIESTEASLRALKVERIGLQQLHTWSSMWLGEGEWLEALVDLKRAGKIAAIGVSLFDHDPESALQLVKSGAVDCVQVMYNLFDPLAAAQLFPACMEHDVAVIVRSALYGGSITPSIHKVEPFQEGDWRRSYFYRDHLQETRARVGKLENLVREPDHSVSDIALRFSLSHPAVSSVAIGMRQRRHVYQNLRVSNGRVYTPAELEELQTHSWLY